MHVYVLNNGQRQGPFLIFKIKEMIDRGELTPSSLGWHDGADNWLPLRELPALSTLLNPVPSEAEAPVAAAEEPPPLLTDAARAAGYPDPVQERKLPAWMDADETEAPRIVRSRGELFRTEALPRFCARALDDILIFSLVMGLAIYDGKADLLEFLFPASLLIFPAISFLGIVIEAWLLSRFGTTFGKWLMGLRVVGDDGLPIDFSTAIGRSLSVWFRGWGIGFGSIVITVSATIQGFLFLKHGITPWDYIKNTQVQHTGLRWWRIIMFIGIVIVFWAAKSHVLWHAPIPEKWPKAQKEQIQELRDRMHQMTQLPASQTAPSVPKN
jgi:uncharacterized RDD family membrane protein YckC